MEKTELKIKVVGENVLRRKAKQVRQVGEEHQDILSRMAQLMYDSSGIGLAAPQVGITQSMIVVDIGQGLYKLVNPRIVRRKGTQVLEEGCLSVPGVCVKVKRAKWVCLEALDQQGEPLRVEAEGLLACVFQHEIDHLEGKLIIDYAPLLQRLKMRKHLEGLKKKNGDERVSKSETEPRRL